MSPTLEDQERHLLVKVIDRILYKLDDLVRPYVHKVRGWGIRGWTISEVLIFINSHSIKIGSILWEAQSVIPM